MTPNQLRASYLNYMEKCGSTVVPSANILPENDPSTLFIGSGMQPMIPYLLGEAHSSGNDVANVQKCLRTGDLEETGDDSHLTFFEMTGRWAFMANPEDFKRVQIQRIWDWQVNELGLDPQNLYISVYQGNTEMDIAKDEEAIAIWRELFKAVGIDAQVEEDPWQYGCSRGGRIFCYDEKENWWSRSGTPDKMPVGEPGGPDSEMFYDFEPSGDAKDHPATDTSRFLEIGNNVFMAYKREKSGFNPLPRPNIDYGGGLERLAAAINKNPDVYLTAFFTNPMAKLEELSGKSYADDTRNFRIVLDHIRAATFLIADGAVPSNVEAGYITRRLMRRAIRVAKKLGIENAFTHELGAIYIAEADAYPNLGEHKAAIIDALQKEEEAFNKTLLNGERELAKRLERQEGLSGEEAFYFFETFGFPKELTEEYLEERNMTLSSPEGFDTAMKAHADKSRTAMAGTFKGGLADHSEMTVALHSVVHLMLAGLRETLGDHVHQKGSNITADRARFDFSHDAKMTDDEKKAVEDYVNAGIQAGAVVNTLTMGKEEAKEAGVEGSFWEKYPETVKVYEMAGKDGKIWSKELCGGPHVENTQDIANFGTFKIKKEGSSSAGVRRIKAVLVA